MNRLIHCLAVTANLLVVPALVAQHEGARKPVAEKPAAVKPVVESGEKFEVSKAKLVDGAVPIPVQHPTPGGGDLQATGRNTWFEVLTRDLGTFYGSGEAHGEFPFENPNDSEVEWISLTPSCQCTSADITVGDRHYRLLNKPKRLVRVTQDPGQPEKLENVAKILVGPHESGKVETHLDMHNITGGKHATLDIHSTDANEPHTKLTFRATGAQLFTISPKEINLNKMTWNETREFTVTVMSPMQKDWSILRMDDAGKAFDVKWERAENQGGNTAWTITGKYGPVDSEVGGGGVLHFHTDVNGGGSFQVRVLAFVQGPLEVKPGGFLTLGLIRHGNALTKEITFEPNDGVDLQVENLEFQKTTLSTEFLHATSRKDGANLIVEMSVDETAPKGLVKGELVIKLNHPLVPEKRIMFNGFVR